MSADAPSGRTTSVMDRLREAQYLPLTEGSKVKVVLHAIRLDDERFTSHSENLESRWGTSQPLIDHQRPWFLTLSHSSARTSRITNGEARFGAAPSSVNTMWPLTACPPSFPRAPQTTTLMRASRIA